MAILTNRVTADQSLQDQVTALRYRLGEARDVYDHGDVAGALQQAQAVAAEAAPLWPPMQAEAGFGVGSIQARVNGPKRATETLPT